MFIDTVMWVYTCTYTRMFRYLDLCLLDSLLINVCNFVFLILPSLSSLVTCLVCVWAESQKATPTFTFGYRRCEALAVFASVTLSLLGAVIIVKECIERLLEPEEVHT